MAPHALEGTNYSGVLHSTGLEAAAHLASLCRVHSNGSIGEQVLQLQSFTEISVPDHAAVLNAHILKRCHALINLFAAIL